MVSTGSDRVRVISLVQESPDEVVIDRITERTGTEGISISFVSFPPGTRRPWSSHDQDQYVWTLSGRGIIATEEVDIELEPGMMIFIPASLRHQHGATEEKGFTQLSIIGGKGIS
jgi:quercetin dioxygenase-like cupin family protein